MKALCQPSAGVCVQCELPLRAGVRRTCRAWLQSDAAKTRFDIPAGTTYPIGPAEPPPCALLGEPTGETVLVKCKGCKGNVLLKNAPHGCEVFGVCLPQVGTVTAEDGKQYHGCVGCERRTRAPAAG